MRPRMSFGLPPCRCRAATPSPVEIRLPVVIISGVSLELGGGGQGVYAIIRTGGKQYRVSAGETIYVERLETAVGEKVTLGEVLFVSGDGDKGEARVGAPLIDKVSVAATVIESGRDHKVRVFK